MNVGELENEQTHAAISLLTEAQELLAARQRDRQQRGVRFTYQK